MKIVVVGLGKLGLPIAATLAQKAEVTGCDQNPRVIHAIYGTNGETLHTLEPGLTPEVLRKIHHCTTDVIGSVAAADFSLVIVPTPSAENGRFTNAYVLGACEQIGRGLISNRHHTVVIVSTVMPGSIDSPIRLTLERYSGGRAGEDFGLVYSPQFVALGSVIDDFTSPDLILIGRYGDSKVEPVLAMYDRVLKTIPQIAVTTPINAELAKLALNCAVSSKIHFANQLARVVEKIPGADVDAITEIIGADRRIGRAYLRAGIMYGGPCFPRDVEALATLPGAVWFSKLARHNEDSLIALRDMVKATSGTIGILGMSYKVGSKVRDCAVGDILFDDLSSRGRTVIDDSTEPAEDVIRNSDVVIVALPDEAYRAMPLEVWTTKPRIVVDCWRMLRHLDRCHEHLTYIPVGIGPRQ